MDMEGKNIHTWHKYGQFSFMHKVFPVDQELVNATKRYFGSLLNINCAWSWDQNKILRMSPCPCLWPLPLVFICWPSIFLRTSSGILTLVASGWESTAKTILLTSALYSSWQGIHFGLFFLSRFSISSSLSLSWFTSPIVNTSQLGQMCVLEISKWTNAAKYQSPDGSLSPKYFSTGQK